MSASYIIAAAREVDGTGTLAPVRSLWDEFGRADLRLTELVIDPLEAGWNTPVAPNHFRSGCAPLEALAHADHLIRDNLADAVLLRGEDYLRIRYANDKARRRQLMAIYGEECPIPEAYTQLARAFMQRHNLFEANFKELAAALFENYLRTAQKHGGYKPPRPEAFNFVTDLFRVVDCANPVVDFAGAVVVASEELAAGCKPAVKILGTGLKHIAGDGPGHIPEIAAYDHLRTACRDACAAAQLDLAQEFREGRALLEAYTCFPVVPPAFLLASGIVESIEEIIPLLARREITVTGGMCLARAPWNNPCLNALVVMFDRLIAGGAAYGAVHGNGGLGYRQGLVILGQAT